MIHLIGNRALGSAAALALTFALILACGGEEKVERVSSEPSEEPAVQPTHVTAVAVSEPEPPIAESEPIREAPVEESEGGVVSEVSSEVSYEEAESAFLEKRYGESTELFTIYSEGRPQNPWGFYMLGLSAWKAGEHERAEEAFRRALELDAGHAKSKLNLSRVYLETGRSEEALSLIDEVIEVDSGSNAALRLQGRAYHELGRPDESIESYRKAIVIDDGDAWSMNNLGLVLIEEERFEEALGPLARAVELRDDIALFQNNLGMALERTGYYRAAEERYRSALALDGSHERAQVNLGRIEGLEEEVGQEPVNLTDLASSFAKQVQGWRDAVAQLLGPEVIEVQPIVEAESDTLEAGERDASDSDEGEGPGEEQR